MVGVLMHATASDSNPGASSAGLVTQQQFKGASNATDRAYSNSSSSTYPDIMFSDISRIPLSHPAETTYEESAQLPAFNPAPSRTPAQLNALPSIHDLLNTESWPNTSHSQSDNPDVQNPRSLSKDPHSARHALEDKPKNIALHDLFSDEEAEISTTPNREPKVDSTNDTDPDLDEEEEVVDPIYPDHYYGGTVPVFKPTMEQFKSFPKFIKMIDEYGMRAGIVKVIPPLEWTASLPDASEQLKKIKIRNPIVQHINGSNGIFSQTNIEKKRSYTLPQWRSLTEESDHQPPARRGERRKGAETSTRGSPRKRQRTSTNDTTANGGDQANKHHQRRRAGELSAQELFEFENFDYRFDASEFTPERCEELEKIYWKTITYNNPMYGADMLGSVFSDDIEYWNVAHLDNLLNDIGVDLPGVNTAYLYFGMWKSTFSWHVEDMDLYSINYIHFGAPKQWYSISQKDEERFSRLMQSVWPDEYKKCKQFLRHKTFLVSPSYLAHHGIKVNKLVHNQGEFVITFPFGYHSGYNLGYNCAESVNFATERWLDIGARAKKCRCVSDAVDIDVDDLANRIRMKKRNARRADREVLPVVTISDDVMDRSSAV